MDMDMGTGMFQKPNMALARAFWYAVAGVVGLFVAVRAVHAYDAWVRLRTRAGRAHAFPTQPRTRFLQAWATLTAVAREVSYPQLVVAARGAGWLTPPPAGRVLLLLVYWAVVVAFMSAGAVAHDVYYLERLGFRNAWVTVTQLPLLYLLAAKSSVLGALAGSSHERLNWLHRWVARTMLVTASVHGWSFYREYAAAGLASYFFEVEPMGKYGIGAWALLLWSALVGLAPLRRLCYELFVLQHVATAVLLLWLVYRHVPAYARYNVWFAVGALVLDRAARLATLLAQNLRLRSPPRSRCVGGRRLGHAAQLRAVGDAITVVTIKDVHFRWRAGQHLYLWIPAIGPLEQHPFTIACAHQLPGTCICNSIQLVVRKHGGFSKRLHARAAQAAGGGGGGNGGDYTVFVSGPYGAPPRWDVYETLVLLSASTGASFTLPILESVVEAALHKPQTICTRRVDFLLAAKKGDEIGYYVRRLHELLDAARDTGLELTVRVAVTQEPADVPLLRRRGEGGRVEGEKAEEATGGDEKDGYEKQAAVSEKEQTSSGSESSAAAAAAAAGGCCQAAPAARHRPSSLASSDSRDSRISGASSDSHVQQLTRRPDIAALVRAAVEATGGETSVVVCGGPSLVARTRNCVAQLSDERAVHKGTGAQGIYLHVEEYGF